MAKEDSIEMYQDFNKQQDESLRSLPNAVDLQNEDLTAERQKLMDMYETKEDIKTREDNPEIKAQMEKVKMMHDKILSAEWQRAEAARNEQELWKVRAQLEQVGGGNPDETVLMTKEDFQKPQEDDLKMAA